MRLRLRGGLRGLVGRGWSSRAGSIFESMVLWLTRLASAPSKRAHSCLWLVYASLFNAASIRNFVEFEVRGR